MSKIACSQFVSSEVLSRMIIHEGRGHPHRIYTVMRPFAARLELLLAHYSDILSGH